MNNAGRELLDLTQDEDATGVKLADVHPPEILERVQREFIPAAVRDGIWNGENTFWSRDGRVIPVLQVILAHKNGSGNVEFLSTIARDLTELKNAQNALHDSGEVCKLKDDPSHSGQRNRSRLQQYVERILGHHVARKVRS
jgi:PAS domain S-box-containing protein